MKFSRSWAMPNADTFSMKPAKEFVERYLAEAKVSVDPFARNKEWFTHTNDINPNTKAQHHMDAVSYLEFLAKQGVQADLLILDMPYSARQISECYKELGIKVTQQHTQSGSFYKNVRDAAMPILTKDATVLSFGWNSVGMGVKRGFEIQEIMLLSHGGPHNDTICMAEKRV